MGIELAACVVKEHLTELSWCGPHRLDNCLRRAKVHLWLRTYQDTTIRVSNVTILVTALTVQETRNDS